MLHESCGFIIGLFRNVIIQIELYERWYTDRLFQCQKKRHPVFLDDAVMKKNLLAIDPRAQSYR